MLKFGRGICYSGYRENQSPITKVYPTYQEIYEDLKILEGQFEYLRMYDPYDHAQTVLKVIRDYRLNFKVMLGVEPRGEISNPNCPWGGLHSDEEIEFNKVNNFRQLDLLAKLANEYQDIIFAVAVGNENTSEWHHNLMPAERIAEHVLYLKKMVKVPVTFCEGAFAWNKHCQPVAKAVDFISIHSYPLWLKIKLDDAVKATIQDYNETIKTYPKKQVIFTEFGWATSSTGQMNSEDTNELAQVKYLTQIDKWAKDNEVTMFLFEAFDEPWKGSNNPLEPEKHWGVYNVDRTPKLYYRQKGMK
ncbi:MAG: glycosyl hydrolase [Tenericutes bacterium HGW-Tenericutes-2]|jgi:hypothetical protein|nr:MAG: glycosyl hydrolase [Tenericutes bacterium HGW-Tenericutes-2]